MRNQLKPSSQGQAKPVGKYFPCPKHVTLKKPQKSHAGQFPLLQCFLILSQNDKLLLGFFCCILTKSRAKKCRLHKKMGSHERFFQFFRSVCSLWVSDISLKSKLLTVIYLKWNCKSSHHWWELWCWLFLFHPEHLWEWHHQVPKRPDIITKLHSTFYCKNTSSLFLRSLKRNWFFLCLLWMLQCYFSVMLLCL